MSGDKQALLDHLATGLTTVCRAWAIERTDGMAFGFTDHDRDITFDGITFRADTGLSAAALTQSTGLSVDNTEALGALSDAAVREDDIEAGRFDDAQVRSWLVNWADPGQRMLQFRGTIGEIRRDGVAFHAELRGLTAALNRPTGRVYQKPCTAVLGDARCRFDTRREMFSASIDVTDVENGRVFAWSDFPDFEPGWFTRGRFEVVGGVAAGLTGVVKRDSVDGDKRFIELWSPIRSPIEPGDAVRVTAGCDKRFSTCLAKFDNLLNFQGFPDIPGDDWTMAVPKSGGANTGGSRR
ncbi:MAG: DUF2163 domain-containing protein [Pseudomonadota bacterium]